MKRLSLFMTGLILLISLKINAEEGLVEEGLEVLFLEIPNVTTSTLTEKRYLKAPSNMTVLTENEIKNSGQNNLFELLDKVPGMSSIKDGAGYQTITFRGILKEHSTLFKILLDGHSINEVMWNDYRFFNIALENIKQIEIIRGPGSALYGSNAYIGIINIITKKASDINGSEVDLKYGSFNTSSINYMAGKKLSGEHEFTVNFNYQNTDGPDLLYEHDRLYGYPTSLSPNKLNEKFSMYNILANYKINNFELDFNYLDNKNHSPLPISGYFTEKGERMNSKFGFIEGKYNFEISNVFKIKTKISYDKFDYENKIQSMPNGFIIPYDLNFDGNFEYYPNGANSFYGYKSNEYRGEILFDYNVSNSSELLFGLFYEKSSTHDIFTITNSHPLYLYSTMDLMIDYSSTVNWNTPETRKIYGMFFQDEWQINEKWYLAIGGRYDKYSDFGSTFNSRSSLIYEYNPKKGFIKLLYGSAFKAPTFAQLYDKNNVTFVGNENLDAEKLNSFELSWIHIFAEVLNSTVTYFDITTKDMIDQFVTPGSSITVINQGKLKTNGFEIIEKYAFKEKNYMYGSFCYNNKSYNEQLKINNPFIPKNQFTLGLNLYFLDLIDWDINLDYTGKLKREQYDPRKDLAATTVVDTTLSIKNWKNCNLTFSIFNLFDKTVYFPTIIGYYPMDDIPRPGRSYKFGLNYKF